MDTTALLVVVVVLLWLTALLSGFMLGASLAHWMGGY